MSILHNISKATIIISPTSQKKISVPGKRYVTNGVTNSDGRSMTIPTGAWETKEPYFF